MALEEKSIKKSQEKILLKMQFMFCQEYIKGYWWVNI